MSRGKSSRSKPNFLRTEFSIRSGKIAVTVAVVIVLLLTSKIYQPLVADTKPGYTWGQYVGQAWIDLHIEPAELDLRSELLRSYWFQLGIYALDGRPFDSIILWPQQWHDAVGLPPLTNGSYEWTSPERIAFWELSTRPPTGAQPWEWQLSSNGDYPWDSYSLDLVFAFNRTMNLGRVTSYVSLNPTLADLWKLNQTFERISKNGLNQTLLSLGFGQQDIDAYVKGQGGSLPTSLRAAKEFYRLQISFMRQSFDILRGTFALWAPAIFLAGLLIVAFGRIDILDTGEALTVFLGTALATLPLVLGALQLLPPRLSLVESVFYAEIATSILFATIALAKIKRK